MNYFLLITHYPYLYKKFALFNPTKSGQFMAISAYLTQLEKISKLLTNSCGGEIISPQKKLILVVGCLVLLSSRRKKMESLDTLGTEKETREMKEEKEEHVKGRGQKIYFILFFNLFFLLLVVVSSSFLSSFSSFFYKLNK